MPANYRFARDTVDSTLLSGVHGRERRVERGIQKIDLQRARRYGMKEDARNGRIKYTYGGIVFIYCPKKKREITSFPSRDYSAPTSGTKVAKPIILEKENSVDQRMKEAHDKLASDANANERTRSKWKSHSVLVVDMSGSMRKDDVNGARCRSDGVWMALARDYVKRPLENKTRDHSDLISIIIMKDDAEIVLRHQPTTWVLYNKLIDMREWDEDIFRPSGSGNYLPSIVKAESLLTSNANAGCALSLLFFSDGCPSDPHCDRPLIIKRVGELASKFGRRLSLSCIGMADATENFSTLNDMITEAQQYGAQASFGKPSLDADSLSNIITSLASSLTTSKTEMTELATGKAKLLRMDMQREKLNTPDHVGSWKVYDDYFGSNFVHRFWSWNYKMNDFMEVVDTRCAACSVEKALHVCPDCNAHHLCTKCILGKGDFTRHQMRENYQQSECDGLQARQRQGDLVKKELPSFSIAVKGQIFSEGAERAVRKVRFLDENGYHVGPVMVAKESRFIGEYIILNVFHTC